MNIQPTLYNAVLSDVYCHICGNPTVTLVPGYELLYRVTSDCRPWSKGGQLCLCQICGCVQKVVDQTWHTEVEAIYKEYAIYHQSNGVEQQVFEEDSGQAVSRSIRLLERLSSHLQLQETGRLLDIGCGNGAFLRAFHTMFPRWSLAGTELNRKYQADVEKIEGVEAFYSCSPLQVQGIFTVISMIHVLEHIVDPGQFLSDVQQKLDPDGILIIEVPDFSQNPFDLLIADHCSHFTLSTLVALLYNAGYTIISVASNAIPKELTLVAKPDKKPQKTRNHRGRHNQYHLVLSRVNWLHAVAEAARSWVTPENFGIFGTSIAATWLWEEIEEKACFFVDEDAYRIGKTSLGRSILHPADLPDTSQVYIPLPPQIAISIRKRWTKTEAVWHLPPPFPPWVTNSAVFLDRDGVLIEDRHLLTDAQSIRVLEDVPLALSKLKEIGFKLIVVSNQPVVARGMVTEQEVKAINDNIEMLLTQAGGPVLDGVYFCPHHPNADLLEYRKNCECRKPQPGLLIQAAHEHQVNLETSFMVGDRITDIIAGCRAGCQTILVQTGQHLAPPIETTEVLDTSIQPDYICADLNGAADWILEGI